MHRFFKKIMLMFFTSLLSITIIYALLIALSPKSASLIRGVMYVINKAEHNSGLPAVILGDSVCDQLWPKEQDSQNITHLGVVQAMGPAGTYILLKKYLENNPQTKDAFYIIVPTALENDLGLEYTYQYFVIPFIDQESMKLLEDDTRQKLYDKFGKFFVENDYIKELLLKNHLLMETYLDHVKKQPEATYFHRLSPTAVMYLRKMRDVCNERGVKFHVLSVPLADTSENYDWDNFKHDVKDYGLDNILGGFIDKISYCPADWYVDGVHFKPEILKQHRDELRAAVMN